MHSRGKRKKRGEKCRLLLGLDEGEKERGAACSSNKNLHALEAGGRSKNRADYRTNGKRKEKREIFPLGPAKKK